MKASSTIMKMEDQKDQSTSKGGSYQSITKMEAKDETSIQEKSAAA